LIIAPDSALRSIQRKRRRDALREYVAHHHLERNHQGLGNALITACSAVGSQDRTIGRRSRLAGILNYYERVAAWHGAGPRTLGG
jgi:hypothetical protein